MLDLECRGGGKTDPLHLSTIGSVDSLVIRSVPQSRKRRSSGGVNPSGELLIRDAGWGTNRTEGSLWTRRHS